MVKHHVLAQKTMRGLVKLLNITNIASN